MLYLVAAKQASFTRNLEHSFNPEGVFKRKSARFKSLFSNINEHGQNTSTLRKSCEKNHGARKGNKLIHKYPQFFVSIDLVGFVCNFFLLIIYSS